MAKPSRITITTFWFDWLLLPIMIGAGWLTARWALADCRLASELAMAGEATLPAWAISVPLFICAAGWMILGFGSLIREEYYEHRIWCAILATWALSCLFGAGVILYGMVSGNGDFGAAGLLNVAGLVAMALMFILPAFIKVPLGDKATRFTHIWMALLTFCVGCLLAGMLLGFPYNFPRFSLGIGAFSFFGLGVMEIVFAKPAFPWLPRLWDFNLAQETFEAGLPQANVWRIEGWGKLVIGIAVAAVLLAVSLT